MSVNILEMAKGALGGSVLDQLGGLLGEGREGTQAALDGALPAILGGMMQSASAPGGADTLSRMADEADSGLLDNIGGLLSNNSGMLMSLGGPLLAMLFGGKQDGLISTIARMAGIGGGSAGMLMKVVAPLIMSMLGKKKKELSLNTDQFKSMLMGQREHVASAMPADVSQSLGFGAFLNSQAEPSAADIQPVGAANTTTNFGSYETAEPTAANDSGGGGGLMKMLLPLAVIAGLGYFAYTQFFSGPDATQIEATQSGVSAIQESVGTVTSSLTQITDVESAQAAAEQISSASGALDSVDISAMGDAGKAQVTGMLGGLVGGIEKALESAYAIPGVQAVIEPAITPFMEKLRGL